MFVEKRENARKIGKIINAIAGCKRTVQARKSVKGKGWPIPYVKGTLTMPKGCTIRQRKKFLQKGVDFTEPNCNN